MNSIYFFVAASFALIVQSSIAADYDVHVEKIDMVNSTRVEGFYYLEKLELVESDQSMVVNSKFSVFVDIDNIFSVNYH